MREMIGRALDDVAAEHGVHVAFAVESGSRAWEFASRDSDWDVRFLYQHPLPWYLGVLERRDSIERMLPGDLDLVGWDLRKAAGLMLRGNVALFEQLGSPIVYREDGLGSRLQEFVARCFNPIGAGHHYGAMARKSAKSALGEQCRIKKLFYVLRALFALRWIEAYRTMPPTAFSELLDGIEYGTHLRPRIDEWRSIKAEGTEAEVVQLRADELAWLRTELESSEERASALPAHRPGEEVVAGLDALIAARFGVESRR